MCPDAKWRAGGGAAVAAAAAMAMEDFTSPCQTAWAPLVLPEDFCQACGEMNGLAGRWDLSFSATTLHQ